MLNMPNAREEQKRVAYRVRQVLTNLGYPDLQVDITWMANARSAMGRAFSSSRREEGELQLSFCLKFSEPLWPRATPQERETTIIHEVAHIIANLEAKQKGRPFPQAHGDEWCAVMRRAGIAEPKRFHNVSLADSYYVMAKCGCAEPHKLSKDRAKKMKQGTRYICSICKHYITLT